ncbi:hypothetical protein BV25DRAFT_1380752 [Artomyces pyxidatus]|uniref:Uncharacterized protein n=1 Tax=Artomyces pyxidatus TaxID=48021 RepID=A0ACB8TDE7_9AGAM|nr:hypothetical protein BV25DRAFT_1380752 [Artomyces pyxidatus]
MSPISSDVTFSPKYHLPLDHSLYSLSEDESAFFKEQTGIQGDAELKQHILNIQAEAYAVHPYPCIHLFSWTRLKIARLSPYPDLLKLGKERKGAIFLDIGCCFGNDLRKAIADGYPAQNVVASDLHKEFWDIGHKLFRDTPGTFPVSFIAGDAFSASHLDVVQPFTLAAPPSTPVPALSTLTSLNPLRGHVSAVHASSFFHLFSEDGQAHLARAMAGLLTPQPGSIIFGQHVGMPEKGTTAPQMTWKGMFCHSPESWRALWDGEIFEQGSVRVETELVKLENEDMRKALQVSPGSAFYLLTWSVTRL